jgi:dTDP-4-dehydrorhamnose reductase
MGKSILVTGYKGQLGQKVKEVFDTFSDVNVVYTDVEELDITSRRSAETIFQKVNPDVVINCSAYTAVDKAETEKETALKVNQKGPLVLAEKCMQYEAFLIHVSTDYVFSGEGFMPYQENEPTKPVNFYGETKVLGEEAIQQTYNDFVIIRTAWLYSEHGNNFVKTMLKLGKERQKIGVIDDQVGSPTYAGDLAEAIREIVKHKLENKPFARGIYHFANEGACSWFDFALKIQELAGNDVAVNPIPTTDYPTPAKRPHYSLLNKRKIKSEFHISIPHWEKSLKHCLEILR